MVFFISLQVTSGGLRGQRSKGEREVKLDELMATLFALEYHDEHETIESALKTYRSIIRSLREEAWANGKHRGDCTGEAIACNRCFIERLQSRAQRLIDEVGDHQEAFKVLDTINEALDG